MKKLNRNPRRTTAKNETPQAPQTAPRKRKDRVRRWGAAGDTAAVFIHHELPRMIASAEKIRLLVKSAVFLSDSEAEQCHKTIAAIRAAEEAETALIQMIGSSPATPAPVATPPAAPAPPIKPEAPAPGHSQNPFLDLETVTWETIALLGLVTDALAESISDGREIMGIRAGGLVSLAHSRAVALNKAFDCAFDAYRNQKMG